MDKNKPFRVRKAAYDVMLVTRDGWLKSTELREKLEDLDFPRRLHSVVIETARSEYQRSFLVMMEILSEDRRWHPYLRRSMEIWLTFRHEEPEHTLIILVNVGELLLPGYDSSGPPPLDDSLEKRLEDEWAAVPGRPVHDLTADRLQPLVEVTEQFNELSFNESDRRAVLAMVERVISFLKKRYDSGYEGPGEDICSMVNGLIEKLQLPMPQSTRRRSTYHW
ncbi:hypothetical protein BDM02DRAFT_2540658 [Thelephora ganbajun]|uniref:Uncharacterized protein n=1 Tax=Thelephora ganbajun TaxID=370292 RepID=A0ACB6YXM0_THEGA|nr:hypothetical protein BDM02DRAFT_2540658 [Thelephora ganbajun]